MEIKLGFPIEGISGSIEVPLVLTFVQRHGKTYCYAKLKSTKPIRVKSSEKQSAVRKRLAANAKKYKENKDEWSRRFREGLANKTIDGTRFKTSYQWALHEMKKETEQEV